MRALYVWLISHWRKSRKLQQITESANKERDEKWEKIREKRRAERRAEMRAEKASIFGEEFVRQLESAEKELNAEQFKMLEDHLVAGTKYEVAIEKARRSERYEMDKSSRVGDRIYQGPRGGWYRINKNGRKSYDVP